MKRYEGQLILNTAGREDGAKDVIDQLEKEIVAAGGKVETTQKMDKRPFARVTDKNVTSGFYVNFIFEGTPAVVAALRGKFALNPDVYRALFTLAPPAVPAKPAA